MGAVSANLGSLRKLSFPTGCASLLYLPPDGLGAAGEEADEGGLAGGGLDDAAALALGGRVQKVVGQADHFAQPVHHDHLQLGAGGARRLSLGNVNEARILLINTF